ncbi:MAG: glucuronate isomerase [Flavitalea sp.]
MKQFLDANFLLKNKTAEHLYHEFAEALPIIDYHCHLPPEQIARDIRFNNLTDAWLAGDHYKWRAMRINGIDESFCTGSKPDKEKFAQWAATVPYTVRNPLYHWTHLELQRYFNIEEILNPESAERIYSAASAHLQTPAYSVRSLMRKMNVETVCTTDDPADSLEHHQFINDDKFEINVYPAFRPDKTMNIDDPAIFNAYVNQLEKVSGISAGSYSAFLDVIKQRHDFFASKGCTIADHGLDQFYAEPYTDEEIKSIYSAVRLGKIVSREDNLKFRSAVLYQLALWHHEKGWVQQYHIGALRNNNSRMMRSLGPDTGWDSIGDYPQARAMSRFLDRLDAGDHLAKTILYNLNPADNELMATMVGNFSDGSVAGKIQFGSGWWFLDQKEGIISQLNALSNMGLLSRFVGMLTDSRSFLSYPRHEYFRRILCNLVGEEIEQGELPSDIKWMGKIIQDICYYNAKTYFNFK